MRWKPRLLLSALTAGLLLGMLPGIAIPAAALHQAIYQAKMAPPSQPAGSWSYPGCGWHTGSCLDNQNGPALDWGWAGYDKVVRFRGWLYRSNSGQSTGYLRLYVFQSVQHDDYCDEAVADVQEVSTGLPRYGMHYKHAVTSSPGHKTLSTSGSGIGAWNDKSVSEMIDDIGIYCPQQGFNAHTFAATVSVQSYWENRSMYPCCNFGGEYYRNNIEANQTHVIQFWEGH